MPEVIEPKTVSRPTGETKVDHPIQPSPAPAAPAPNTAAIPPAPGPTGGDDNPYAELDAAMKKFEEPATTTQGKGDEPKEKPAAPPATPPKPNVPMPKELRAELDRVKGELKTKTEAFAALEAKIAEAEAKGKDTTVLTERLNALEKQMEDKDAEIRALRQEASPDFKKKYDEPFNRLADRARSVVEKIMIEDPDTGAVRAATWGEFSKVYALDEFTALRESKRLFGEDGAQIAMGYYRQLHEMDDSRRLALEEEKKQWKEKDAAEQARQIQSREEIARAWKTMNAELAEKVEDYHDSPEDKEAADARTQALALYDARPANLRARMVKDAHNRQRVAAFAVQKLMLARKDKEIAELRAELDGLKEKPPGKTQRSGGTPSAKPEDDFETGLRKAVSAA